MSLNDRKDRNEDLQTEGIQSGPTTTATTTRGSKRPPAEVDSRRKKKRQKTEQDYHRGEAEGNLRSARRYALQGNRRLMEFCFRQARENYQKANSVVSTLEAQIQEIRGLLLNEDEYHTKEFHEKLERAIQYSFKGDRRLMEYCLNGAQKHADDNPSLQEIFRQKSTTIRNSLLEDYEVAFHQNAARHEIDRAKYYARQGNRRMMESMLQSAKENAQKIVDGLNDEFIAEETQVRGMLANETDFHRREFEKHMAGAQRYASAGNRRLLEFKLKQAKTNGVQANCWDDAAEKQAKKLRSSLLSAPSAAGSTES